MGESQSKPSGADAAAEPGLERVARLAATLFGASTGLVALAEEGRFALKAVVGPDAVDASPTLIEQTLRAPDSVATVETDGGFHAGAVAKAADGTVLAVVGVLNADGRATDETRLEGLRDLAGLVREQLATRCTARESAEQRQLLQITERMASVGHWRYDLSSHKVAWSDELYQIHGVKKGLFDPNTDDGLRFHSARQRRRSRAAMKRAVETGEPYAYSRILRRPDGEIRHILSKTECVRDEQGAVTALHGVLQDVTDHRRALKTLRAEQVRHKVLADNAADVIALLSFDGVVLYISPSVSLLKAVDPAEVVGRQSAEFLVEEDRPAYRQVLAEVAAGGPEHIIEHRTANAAGEPVWIESRIRLALNEAKRPSGIISASREITERKRLEETLKAARDTAQQQAARADLAEGLAGLGHWRLDALTGEINWSDQLYAIYGIAPGSPMDFERAMQPIHPEDRAESMAFLDRLGAGSQREHFIARIFRGDGEIRFVEIFARAERDAYGVITAYHGAVMDIHERRKAEITLAESEARYRLLADRANDLIVRCDMDARLTYVSPSVRNILGYEAEELIGVALPALLHDDDRQRVLDQIAQQVAANDGLPCGVEYRLIGKDGAAVWVEGNPSLEVDPQTGQMTGAIDVLRNITARKALEMELRAARAEAEAAAAAKSEFLANMSHELRTPLTSIIGFTHMALDQPDLPRTVRGYVDRVADASRTLLCAVNDILDFSKLEAGQIGIDPQPVSLTALCRATLDLFTPQAAAKDLRLVFDGPEEPDGLVVSVDPDRMRQVLLNLVGNAVKFTDAGQVTMRLRHDPDRGMLQVDVIDTGPGVPEDKLGLLFKRFSQVDGSLSRSHGGTGLGLAICKGVIEAMGGAIGVESTVGEGSRFWLSAPAPLACSAPPQQVADESDGTDFATLRVLVVDDHPANRELARLFLQGVGAQVTEAVDGQEAAERAVAQAFDVIVMDVRMPRLNGPDALRKIRSQGGVNAKTPILAFTADASADDAARLSGLGFCGVVTKPVDPVVLLTAVGRAVAGSDSISETLAHAG